MSKIVLNFPKRNPFASEVSMLSQGLKFIPTEKKLALKIEYTIRRILKNNFSLSGPLEMMGNLSWLPYLDKSLQLIQGIRILSASHSIWVVGKKGYCTLRFLLEGRIIILRENRIYCTIWKMTPILLKRSWQWICLVV